jgi:hypothetical protein
MVNFSKTDNHDPRAKLELRRYFLRKYHRHAPAHVLDCCMGKGFLWKTLAREFPLASYWGVDVKPEAGRLKIDSARILAQRGWTQNVIDIDTYGSPWKHWRALLPNVTQPLTVFLTIGQVNMGTDKFILQSLGLGALKIPRGIAVNLHDLALRYCLHHSAAHGVTITDAMEARRQVKIWAGNRQK